MGDTEEANIKVLRLRRVGLAEGYTGKEDWSIHDFLGKYHANKTSANDSDLRYGIPGISLHVENERKDREIARERSIKRIMKDCNRKAFLRQKRERQSKAALDKIKEQYGFHRQIKEIDELLTSIDVAANKYISEKIPNYLDPKLSSKLHETPNLEGAQKQFAQDVLKGNRLEVHRAIIGGYKDVDILINQFDTPLTYAVRTANVEMIKTLVVDGKANPNFPNAHGYSSLFFVYEEWKHQKQHKVPGKESLKDMLERANGVLNILLDNGGNVNARGIFGETPVHLAASFGDAKSLFTLCRYQFDPTIADGLGRTALDVALEHEKPECAIILHEWPKIRREVGLGFFINEWKPFLNDPLRHINLTPAFEEILGDLALADRVRENKRVERLNELGTTIRFYAEDDNAEDATKAGAHLGEQGMQSIKDMKRAMMLTEKSTGARELDIKLREIKKREDYQRMRQTRKRRGKSRRRRHTDDEETLKKPLTAVQVRRKSMVGRLLTNWCPSPPKKKKDLVLLEKPLRSANASALFRPKRTDLYAQARAARASTLPVGIKRRTRRKRLEEAMGLPTHADLDAEEQRRKDMEYTTSLENQKPKSAMIPDEMLPPPPSAAALGAMMLKDKDDVDKNEKSMLQNEMEEEALRKQKLVPRSTYPGIRGLPKLNKTWRQSPYSLGLVSWKDGRDTAGYQVF